jgi:hypothetical protein
LRNRLGLQVRGEIRKRIGARIVVELVLAREAPNINTVCALISRVANMAGGVRPTIVLVGESPASGEIQQSQAA